VKKKTPAGEVSPSLMVATTMVAATPTAPSHASPLRAQAPREYRLIMKTATKEIELASKSAAKCVTAMFRTATMTKIGSGAFLRRASAREAAIPRGIATSSWTSGWCASSTVYSTARTPARRASPRRRRSGGTRMPPR
jgi:hypothetical protein